VTNAGHIVDNYKTFVCQLLDGCPQPICPWRDKRGAECRAYGTFINNEAAFIIRHENEMHPHAESQVAQVTHLL